MHCQYCYSHRPSPPDVATRCRGLLLGLCLLLLWPVMAMAGGLSAPTDGYRPLGHKASVVVQPSSYVSVYVDLRSNTQQVRFTVSGSSGNIDLMLKRGVPHRGASLQALLDESTFSATSPAGNEVLVAQRGSAPSLSAGRWWLAVVNLSASTQTIDLQFEQSSAGTPFALGAGQSGTWYQPEKNYQGIFLEMIGGGSALAVWFTYHPDGRQAFMTAVGSVDGDRIVFPAVTKTRGGRFGAAFDPTAVVREDWGSLVFTFESCGVGYASYLPNAAAAAQGWAAEQLNAQRLTSVAGLACPGAAAGANKYLHGGISGAWYDPARDGEGWLVEVLSANLGLVYWFSYTPTANRRGLAAWRRSSTAASWWMRRCVPPAGASAPTTIRRRSPWSPGAPSASPSPTASTRWCAPRLWRPSAASPTGGCSA